MTIARIQVVLNRIHAARIAELADVEEILRCTDPRELDAVLQFADAVRREHVGDGVLLRGIIEFSNVCRNTCGYCGLNRANTAIRRYRMAREEILDAAGRIRRAGIRTVVLQSGEEDNLDIAWLARIIEEIKAGEDTAVTLSLGERRREEYEQWKQAGADRYLLKIETSDPGLYRQLHPGMSFENRIRCLHDLADLGYQTGSGNLVGLRGQTVGSLARDIRFFQQGEFDMVSVSPFIPHPNTPLADQSPGDLAMTLKMIALTRIVTRDVHIPATTAIGSLNGRDERHRALTCGANVLMPNFTPKPYRQDYEIYPSKRCTGEDPETCAPCTEHLIAVVGRWVDYSRGDSIKSQSLVDPAQPHGVGRYAK